MLDNLNASHLTGSAKVIENYWTSDLVVWRNRRNLGQMFFQPYESKKEFFYCARHTLTPLAYIGLAILDPILAVAVPTLILGAAIGLLAVGGFSKLFGFENTATFCLDYADYFATGLCQDLIDLVLLPATAVAMLTRGISTGLKATSIYDYDAPVAPSASLA